MTITVKQMVQLFAPFRLEGDDLREFVHTIKGLKKSDDLVVELHVEEPHASGYARVTVPEDPDSVVTFPAPPDPGTFTLDPEWPDGPDPEEEPPELWEQGEDIPLPVVSGRAELTVKPPEPNGILEEALAGRVLLPDSVAFNSRALEAIRSRERMTQRQLGAQINVSGGALGFWERGAGKPSIANVRKLADALGVGVDKLLTVSRS